MIGPLMMWAIAILLFAAGSPVMGIIVFAASIPVGMQSNKLSKSSQELKASGVEVSPVAKSQNGCGFFIGLIGLGIAAGLLALSLGYQP